VSAKQWEIHATLKYHTTVCIEAETAEEAMVKFHEMDWVDDGLSGAECINHFAHTMPKQVYP
jgi:hypothetical protein